ncbi:alcohol dehydrogenase catalytic domain-containing protein [Micromonospora sp. CPCC 206061]|uniref:alcohol dehydrogenase catalytic domain-containing protein n=1 Tax=Micromonospora sp. CPCC 206061 TaxID=3122410 RepID=UPI002FEED7EE
MFDDVRPAATAVQVHAPGGRLTVTPISPRTPDTGEVCIDVAASGVCGADAGTVGAGSPSAGFPITPGHEVAGVIAEVGPRVSGWQPGDRVTVGWFGGSCGHCIACRRGDVVHCPDRQVPGLSYPGGWATTITVPATTLARIPDALSFVEAAPFGCAGVTTFNALRHGGAQTGDRVAVIGIGGLGHLAVQFAAAMGYETVAVSRGDHKRQAALDLGAHHYINTDDQTPGAALKELGGATLIVSTAATSALLADLITGLTPHGRLTVAGFDATAVHLPMAALVMHARTIGGHLTGSPADTEQAMRFAAATGIRPRTQTLPLEQAEQALISQQAGDARFRVVLTTGEHPR